MLPAAAWSCTGGVERGEPRRLVADVRLDRGADMVTAMLASGGGGRYLSPTRRTRHERLAFMLGDSGTKAW
ncbi:hypothetical protein A4E84_04280 [Streptomyces qaidamensis]|uniref:Uncharacterized protein n=1 Tax=Streptomyces qaidamensis TaxID=1783515 RepID=A0A143BU92_9ACTN|nr:hypothetical protein A4E84_04280 [Streptomyces qaidamensis]